MTLVNEKKDKIISVKSHEKFIYTKKYKSKFCNLQKFNTLIGNYNLIINS